VSDVRESILARLYEIAKTVDPSARRMEVDVDPENLPYLVLIDGEEVFLGEVGKREVQAPGDMHLTPHFAFLVVTSDNAGPTMSTLRRKLISAVCNDETLRNLTGVSHGRNKIGAQYTGNDTNVQLGEGLVASMILHFSIVYRFNLADL